MSKPKVIFTECVCAFLVLLFLYAALTKLLDYQKFAVQIGQSPVLAPFAGAVAWLVPLTEILLVALFLIPVYRLQALYGSFMLMALFTAYIASILSLSENIPCSCGGVLERLSWTQHLAFNAGTLVLIICCIMFRDEEASLT